ncbi:MAG TPA: farnesyl diphosphate synthase [Gammaproteobacteria bacterium]|nr:farnesyl diphosphate synthase [Gammaproteobacteria bacterium]
MSTTTIPLLARYRARADAALEARLPDASLAPERLHAAMRYAVTGGGKRLRPALCYATGEALAIPPEILDAPACSVEFIHAYSLVHDDLPAMDDDELRRGRPTCHRAFDEATAILAGDALQSLAFHTLCHDPALDVTPQARLGMVAELALACGSRGMVGGQMLDLQAEGRSLDVAELEFMHIHKTGALIRASVMLAALALPGLAVERRQALDHMAKCIGLAFQIRDDLLDVEGDTGELGKRSGADAERGKCTYVSALGLDGARERLAELHREALGALEPLGSPAEPLRTLCNTIVERRS